MQDPCQPSALDRGEGDPQAAAASCGRALAGGVISLLSGDDARVLGIHPPLSIEPELLFDALDLLVDSLP